MIHRLWIRFQAFWRLSNQAICEASRGMALVDYHDYPDGIAGEPWHFHTHVCKRCGKEFTI